MKRWVVAGAFAALSLGTVSAGVAWAQADVVAEREAGMKRMNGHLQAIKVALEANGPVSPLAERAEDMRAFFQTLPSRFPAGSAENSKALPAIWSDMPAFERAGNATAALAEKLAGAARDSDVAGVAAAFREVAASCVTCHRAFRAR